jgi:hypothetical protein
MRVSYLESATVLGIPPLQVLVELAAMNQPWAECWPICDEGFVQTLAERRRLRMGFSVSSPRSGARPAVAAPEQLPVSTFAAAILDKLLRKSYGLKSIRVSTLVQKWVHGATKDHVQELLERGNLEWSDTGKSTVNLVADRLPDTERIVDVYRITQSRRNTQP